MKKASNYFLTFFATAMVTLSGCCVVPGSNLGLLRLTGHIDDYRPGQEPLRVKILLPKVYGLGDIDRVFGQPEDYGHRDKVELREVGQDGAFSVEFEVVYHVTVLLLPPLGGFPKRPPTPVYVLGFSDAREEVYVIDFEKEKLHYTVYHRPTRVEIPHEKAVWAIVDGSVKETKHNGRPALDIVLLLKRS